MNYRPGQLDPDLLRRLRWPASKQATPQRTRCLLIEHRYTSSPRNEGQVTHTTSTATMNTLLRALREGRAVKRYEMDPSTFNGLVAR